MPVYIYETVPAKKGEKPVRFEVRQSMRDAALTHHPETGQPVRRVITGGYGILEKSGGSPRPSTGEHSCGMGCGCASRN
jgi:predicted nucleic acid-binding Zn ribbon protein